MSEIHYFEGKQRIQREAVMEVLESLLDLAPGQEVPDEIAAKYTDAEGNFNARKIAADVVLTRCEQRASSRFGSPVLVLSRRSQPGADITLKIV